LKLKARQTWRLIKPHARPRFGQLALVVLLGMLASLAQSAALLLIAPLWNLVLFPGQAASAAGGVRVETPGWIERVFRTLERHIVDWSGKPDFDPRLALLLAVVGVLFGLGVVHACAEYAFTRLSRLVSYRMVVDLRLRIARHLMGLSMRYHGKRRLGDLLSRISADVNTTLLAINVGLKELVQEPASAVFYLAIAAWTSPWLGLTVVLALPLAAIPLSKLAQRVRRRSTKSLDSLGASVQALTQMFQGIRAVKAFRAEERELERYRELNEGYLRASMRMVHSIALTHAWTGLFSLAGMAGLVLLIGWMSLRFEVLADGAQMAIFVGAIAQASNHIKSLTKALTRVQESVGASERLQALLDEQPDVVEAPQPRRLAALGSGLRFEHASFSYPGSNEPAIRGLDLQIRSGETLALVGPSGAGKSTLVDLVCRFIDPTEGALLVDGVPLREVALDDWTRLYARVDQIPFLFHSSVGENIRYGRPEATQAEVEAAARAAGLHEFIAALPEGYDTDIADMGSRLSGGQRQRLTIARAFLKAAPLLVLDEATSSLDSESESVVQQALERLMDERTVIVIAHRLSTVRRADRIAVLDEGRLVELGTHEELLARGGTYARLYRLQQLAGTPA
jgi:subfamily B ATP-binding cassette protein MsbA